METATSTLLDPGPVPELEVRQDPTQGHKVGWLVGSAFATAAGPLWPIWMAVQETPDEPTSVGEGLFIFSAVIFAPVVFVICLALVVAVACHFANRTNLRTVPYVFAGAAIPAVIGGILMSEYLS